MTKQKKQIFRGDVYWANLDPTIGTEVRKTRPAVVVSNNMQNNIASRVVVIPITSNITQVYPFEVAIEVDNKPAKAMADQIRTIDKSRLQGYLGKLKKIELDRINIAIKLVLNLD